MRFWSVLFLLTMLLCVGVFGYAAIDPDWWLTKNASERGPLHFGAEVDHLLILILIITGVIFVITHVALVWVLWRYRSERKAKVIYSHGNTWLEVGWTLIPAAILIFLAFYQYGSWMRMKVLGCRPRTCRWRRWRKAVLLVDSLSLAAIGSSTRRMIC